MKENDAFILIAEKKERCEKAMELAIGRANMAMEEVPSETRGVDSQKQDHKIPQAYTRRLEDVPGNRRAAHSDLCSPEEDRKQEDRHRENKEVSLSREIKNKQLAEQMLWSKELLLYEEIVNKTNADPMIVASILLEKFRELSRAGVAVETISTDALEYLSRST